MQTLNTLSTSEEKLAALCKKYAELVSAWQGWRGDSADWRISSALPRAGQRVVQGELDAFRSSSLRQLQEIKESSLYKHELSREAHYGPSLDLVRIREQAKE